MDRLRTARGRYVPLVTAAADADRLRHLEAYVTKYSEENECAMNAVESGMTELKMTVQALQTALSSMAAEMRR